MPAMFAIGSKVIGGSEIATFAAFGSFAMLLLADFSGPKLGRIQARIGLSLVGAVFVCLGTLASRWAWVAAIAMAVVAFAVLLAASVSSVLAGATTALLLAFILPVCLPGDPSVIPERLEGWALAAGGALVASLVLWPVPARDPLRGPAIAACRAIAGRLRIEVGHVRGEPGVSSEQCEEAAFAARQGVHQLRQAFYASPYRPTGLSTSARTVVRLVDELSWLVAIVDQSHLPADGPSSARKAGDVKLAAAEVLERGAELLDGGPIDGVRRALTQLRARLDDLERTATAALPVRRADGSEQHAAEFLTALDPTFRAQEMSFAVKVIGENIVLTAAAEQRHWWQQLLGRQPEGVSTTLVAAQERAASFTERHSVWLHNSLRGAVSLGLAVLVADLTEVQHAFWVVLAAISVLRSNALSTGQNILRGMIGTTVGIVIGGALVWAVGTNINLLWALLPVAILLAGLAPATISFAAGQAAFTLTVVILFNIIEPVGWKVGLVRIEDIALGCAVSLAVGVLFWPRGASSALGQALAEAYSESGRYLQSAVDYGVAHCDEQAASPAVPHAEALHAAAASRRLDDAFRGYLAERGAKPISLGEVTSMITGVAGLRLAADAVLQLWEREDGSGGGDRERAREELRSSGAAVAEWYDELANALAGRGPVPQPIRHDKLSDARLIDAVRRDLSGEDARGTATAVRMIWTGDHLDAARRLQRTLIGPAAELIDQHARGLLAAGPHLHPEPPPVLSDADEPAEGQLTH
ncbi:MAG: FUSC family protein [Actinobacteria bacterium]|nr:FUSC family protein [Actinomycetota bacterium]